MFAFGIVRIRLVRSVFITAAVSGAVVIHAVLLLEASSGVGEPRGDLVEAHSGYDRQHDLLAFSRVRVLSVLVEPCF